MSKNPLDNIEESIVESSLKYDDHDPKKRAELMQWLTRSKEARAKANKRNFQPQKIKGKVYGARDFVFVNKTEPLNIDITPLPQMRPLSVDNLKGCFTAGTKPKVSEGLAKILGVDND